MNEFEDHIEGLKSGLPVVPFGGMMDSPTEETPIALAQKIKGGFMTLPTLEALADIPYQILVKDMEVAVAEHVRPGGVRHLRTRYYLVTLPPPNTRISEIPSYVIENYWRKVTDDIRFDSEVQTEYAPNYNGSRPAFLPTEISAAGYQAGYGSEADYLLGNPALKIWESTYSPTKNHIWVRQRVGTQPWGIPVSLSAGNYETNQFIDVIFRWLPKASPFPARPVQPNDYSLLPTGWQATPGNDYATRILTEDLYRSQAVKNAYGIPKSEWDIPILVSTDPVLVRYGNQPGNTNFLNDVFWRGYYTPGLDTFMATRPTGASTTWTVTKIDQESGEFDDFVFRAFPIGTQQVDLIAATPTIPVPLGTVYPNDWKDAPFEVGVTELLYMSKATKYSDGSLKTGWSVPKRFDGLDTIQAVIEESPGDSFYQTRNNSGNLVYAFSSIAMVARLYKGNTELTAGITGYKWYRDGVLIVFSGITFKATNLGGLNDYHTISADGKTLTVNPEAIGTTNTYKAGITHPSRATDYEDTIQLFDSTDDATSFVADAIAVQGTVFKNQAGLYQFNANFYKGGVLDTAGVTFRWSIKNSAGGVLTGGLRNAGGVSIGDTNVVAATVYVQGSDISQYATLILEATYGGVVREDRLTLTDVEDGNGVEALYWGTGSVDPGFPTNFTPRTLTKAQVLALAIGYTETATGTWYVIWRVAGEWSQPVKIRSESARPNGGIALLIYKNVDLDVDGAPLAPPVPPTGSIIPAGWTAAPTAFTGSQDHTFSTSCFFLLRTDVNADPTVLTRDNYNPSGTYGTPKKITGDTSTTPGPAGNHGWTPVIAVVPRGATEAVLQIVDWQGGTGTKPAAGGTMSYIGTAGLTTLAAAVNIRGPQGDSALVRPQYYTESGSHIDAVVLPAFGFSTAEEMRKLVVTNSWSQARFFRIEAFMAFREDFDYEIIDFELQEKIQGSSTWFLKARTRIRVDVDFEPPSQFGTTQTLQFTASIGAGQTYEYRINAYVRRGVGALRNGGYMIATGL